MMKGSDGHADQRSHRSDSVTSGGIVRSPESFVMMSSLTAVPADHRQSTCRVVAESVQQTA